MPTAIAHSDMNPSPRVELTFPKAELHIAAVTGTVMQVAPGGQQPVRNADRVTITSGGVFVVDYEVPLGIPLTWRLQQFDAAGNSIGFSNATPHVTLLIDPGYVVLQDPLAPRNAVLLDAHADFAGTLQQSRDMQMYQAGGRSIALLGPQGMLESVPLRVNTRTKSAAAALAEVLAEAPVLIRTMPDVTILPPLLYAALGQTQQVPMDVQFGGEWVSWPLVGHQVIRPTIEIIEAPITYTQFKVAFASYTAAKAEYTTYTDAKKNPPPAV